MSLNNDSTSNWKLGKQLDDNICLSVCLSMLRKKVQHLMQSCILGSCLSS